jgi:HK/GC/Chemotaxis protein-like, sensor domain
MRKILCTLLVLALLFSACTVKKGVDVTKSTVSMASAHLDKIFMNTLASLELVATTSEAQSLDWTVIKPYLEKLKAELPGVYFFVLPDGNYYSVTKDFTNLNLSNRDYFKPLFEGNPVVAHPLYSRSTGKRSALMATPIMKDGQVIAAIGASVFLNDLHVEMNKDLDLPVNYLWYVLDSEGNTMLKDEGDFIFINAMEKGSQSLKDALEIAFTQESGMFTYEMAGQKTAHYKKLKHLDWWLMIAKREGKIVEHGEKLTLSLDRFVPELKESLHKIDASLAKCLKEANTDFTSEKEIRILLTTILERNQDIVESNFITLGGILRYIEPADYRNFENADISMQDHVIALRKNPQAEFSSGFMAVEGFLAVDLAYPVYDKEGKLFGSVSVLIRPELLIKPLLKKSKIPEDYELWIMQTDGMIVYDQDTDEIGKMLFSDPAYAKYESLLELGKKMAAKPEGEGSYVYLAPDSEEKAIKEVIWKTIKLHEREWRVILGYRPYKK